MHRIGYTLFILTTIIGFETRAQNSVDSIKRYLEDYSKNVPPEKIYIHLDKPYYLVGDTIWFKAYVIDGTFHHPDTVSKVIYVDFQRKVDGKVIYHKVLRNENGFAHGEFTLPDSLVAGAYEITGYTNWMLNFPDCIFRKEAIVYSSELIMISHEETDSLEVADIQFFPEGGNMIAGLQNRVGFKAVNRYGKGVDFKAFVISEHRDTIVTISSQHLGMGSFIFQPRAKEKYHVAIEKSHHHKQFQMPPSADSGYTFFVDNLSDKEAIRVKARHNFLVKDRPMLLCQQRGVVAFALRSESEGNSFAWIISKKQIEDNGVVQLTLFNGQGVPQCERLVYNEKEMPLQIFITSDKQEYRPREMVSLSIHVQDQDDYPIEGNFSLSVTDYNQAMPEVNGNNIFTYLNLTSDVRELEHSGIRGIIEQPGYYFNRSNPAALVALDVLLMTQGWRRFLWQEVLEHKNIHPRYEIESGITLRGNALLPNGKNPDKPVTLTLAYADQNETTKYLTTTTDTNGKFIFRDMDTKSMSRFFLQGKKDNGSKNVLLTVDKPNGPKYQPRPELTEPLFFNNRVTHSVNNQLRIDELTLKESQSKVKVLKEVVVTAKRDDPRKFFYETTPAATVVIDKRMCANAFSVLQMLQGRVAGLHIDVLPDGTYIPSVRGQTEIGREYTYSVAILVDGIRRRIVDLERLSPCQVESIDVVTSNVPVLDVSGLISILTKPGSTPYSVLTESQDDGHGTLLSRIQGYDVPKEFYSPKYPLSNVSSKPDGPDFRSTLFWKPILKTDEEGNAKVVFWNSDEHTSIRISLEGMSKEGKPGYATYQYNIK